MHGPESILPGLIKIERSRTFEKANRLIYTCFPMMSLVRLATNLTPVCTGTAFSFMSNAIRVKNKVKENLENNERSHKRKLRLADGHKNEAQNHKKT